MDFDVAHWTILACLQVFHNTTFADCSTERKAFGYSPDDFTLQNITVGKRQKRFQSCRFVFQLTRVQTLCNCCGVYEVAGTKVADDVFVQVLDLQLDLLLL